MEPTERDLAGQVVGGRFRVESRLGSGGMGTVWRVEHVESLQKFALKTLDSKYATEEEATRRFLNEARAAGALRTRHVVRIIDAQMQHVHQGQPLPFLVMELLDGQNLQQILDERGRISPGELVWMATQLGRALGAAHQQGIVHRDLKPSNVFIAQDQDDGGQPIVKLCDFGIAKLTGDTTGLAADPKLATRTGALLGTPMYLAPELLRGAGAAVPATDQWALGLIAFRALAGFEYFAHVRGFPDLVLTIANDPLAAPSARSPALSRAFDTWFLRSCARRPEERFPDVPAQAAALEAALGRPAPRPIARRPEATTGVEAIATADTAAPPPVARARTARRAIFLGGTLVWAVAVLAVIGWRGRSARPAAATAVAVSAAAAEAPSAIPPPPAPAAKAPPEPTLPPATPARLAPPAEPAAVAPAAPHPAADHAHKRPRPATPRPAAPSGSPAGRLLPPGAACQRSAQCASGLCAAETCQ
jgi:tRNA A-37 threonylcarbamoyl transferase component Bud32